MQLIRGMRVIVSGRLRQRSYETKESEKRTAYEVEVDRVSGSPSLRKHLNISPGRRDERPESALECW